jgi:hypothetical protein
MSAATSDDSHPKTVAPADAGRRASTGKTRWPRRHLARLAVAVVVSAAAAAPWLAAFSDRYDEPRCQPAGADAPAAGCIAQVRISGIDIAWQSIVGLMPDGRTLLVAGMTDSETKKLVLAGLDLADGTQRWRTPLSDVAFPLVSVSPGGGKAAVWDPRGPSPIHIVHLPGGAPLVNVPDARNKSYDVVFSDDESAIVTGAAAERRVFSLSDPTAEPTVAPGFNRSDCGGGFVGKEAGVRSHSRILQGFRSRDNGLVVFVLSAPFRDDPIQTGHVSPTDTLLETICGTKGVAVLPAVDADRWFASFSPGNKRLAIVYAEPRRPQTLIGQTLIKFTRFRRQPQTLIEIWDTEGPTPLRLAAFPIPGGVGNRIGWSQDEHRLAVVRTDESSTDAFIYAIP